MKEFEEIAHAGGKIEFLKREGGTSFRFSFTNPTPAAMFFVAADYNGIPIHHIQVGGLGMSWFQVEPSILAPIVSDREGLFGRLCPACGGYFRTNVAGRSLICPYCELPGENVVFTTPNQRMFLASYCAAFLEAARGDDDIVISLDDTATTLRENRQGWVYTEERQQRRIGCGKCKALYEILGEYGACPDCGTRNNAAVLAASLQGLTSQWERSAAELTERHSRGAEWERLTVAAVAAFEGMANDLRRSLLRLAYTPRRRQELSQLSFQNITGAAERLGAWFGFDFLSALAADDKTFLLRVVNKRHLITHNAGVVDDEYIRNTGDTTLRRGQRIRIDSADVSRALRLIGIAGNALATGYASIQYPRPPQDGASGTPTPPTS